jgi:hypothetical protein
LRIFSIEWSLAIQTFTIVWVQSIPEVYRNSPKKRSGTSSRSIARYRRTAQLEVDISGFLNVAADFKRMLERPSVKKLLAFDKEVNERFAKTVYAIIEFRKHTHLQKVKV